MEFFGKGITPQGPCGIILGVDGALAGQQVRGMLLCADPCIWLVEGAVTYARGLRTQLFTGIRLLPHALLLAACDMLKLAAV